MEVKELKKERVAIEDYLVGVIRDALVKFHAKTGAQIKSVSVNIDETLYLESKETEYSLRDVDCEIDL